MNIKQERPNTGAGKKTWAELSRSEKITGTIILIIFVFAGIWGISSLSSSGSTTSVSIPAQPTYADQARARFDTILASSPELSGIACENDDCSSSVVYFDYRTIPDDFDTVIRGNAATYSKFGLDNHAISHVTVAARSNGKVFYACNAADGAVTKCDTYSK